MSGHTISSPDIGGRHPQEQSQQPSWPKDVPIPKAFICPLTKRLMKHPVVDREGNSYEKVAILKYVRRWMESSMGFAYSPVTMSPLRESDLMDNMGLQIAINAATAEACKKQYEADQSAEKPMSRLLSRADSLSRMKNTMLGVSITGKFTAKPGGDDGELIASPSEKGELGKFDRCITRRSSIWGSSKTLSLAVDEAETRNLQSSAKEYGVERGMKPRESFSTHNQSPPNKPLRKVEKPSRRNMNSLPGVEWETPKR